MSRSTRKECRERLGVLLSASVAGTDNPAQVVYDHLKEDFGGRSPVVCVGSSSVRVEQLSFGDDTEENYGGEYGLEIMVFAAREDEEVAEDALDDVMEAVFKVLAANKDSNKWDDIGFSQASSIVPADVGGEPYWMEVLPITVISY
jgi:hypothetical protein